MDPRIGFGGFMTLWIWIWRIYDPVDLDSESAALGDQARYQYQRMVYGGGVIG